MAITSLDQLDPSKVYSYADYLQWQFEEMVELIQGKIVKMSPAPNRRHQNISMKMGVLLYQAIEKTSCKVYSAPFDVRLYDRNRSIKADQEIFTVVQPDLCVVCDHEKLDEQGCNGAPDLVVEILSKGNSKKEMRTKFDLYQGEGVSEYLVVFPYENVLQQFVLNSTGKYQLKDSFVEGDILNAHIFPELHVSLDDIFAE
ncbi:MAG: Uma2 family endonuclease [Bacteroidota bacterium]